VIQTQDGMTAEEGEQAAERALEARVAIMVKRRFIDIRRRERRMAERDAEYLRERTESVHTWMDPEAQWIERECQELYDKTLASLPPRCQAAFVAVREEGRSYAEAAQILGMSVRMVAKHITNAHRVFRVALRDFGIPVPKEGAVKGRRIEFESTVAYVEPPSSLSSQRLNGVDASCATCGDVRGEPADE
jgi:RNA polymerase sigma factor (sigma-70 family)